MAVNAIKYSESELKPILDEAKETESEVGFVKSFLSGVARSLFANPETYRSYGVYWWPLKELMIEHGIMVFGTGLESETTEHFRYESDELTCCAAYAMQQTKLANHSFLSSDNLLELEGGEVEQYGLYDTKMEDLAVLHNFRKRKASQ